MKTRDGVRCQIRIPAINTHTNPLKLVFRWSWGKCLVLNSTNGKRPLTRMQPRQWPNRWMAAKKCTPHHTCSVRWIEARTQLLSGFGNISADFIGHTKRFATNALNQFIQQNYCHKCNIWSKCYQRKLIFSGVDRFLFSLQLGWRKFKVSHCRHLINN